MDDFDIDTEDAVIHKNIPYVVILIKLAEEWKNMHDGMLPSTREEKKQFKVSRELQFLDSVLIMFCQSQLLGFIPCISTFLCF